jgi:hypothetical protein
MNYLRVLETKKILSLKFEMYHFQKEMLSVVHVISLTMQTSSWKMTCRIVTH